MRGQLRYRFRSAPRTSHACSSTILCTSVEQRRGAACSFCLTTRGMAKQTRLLSEYPKPYYTISGRHAKQTEFSSEVREFCLDEQSQTLANSVTVSLSSRSGKVIIIGAPGVGKTSLLLRYCQHVFESHYKNTIGVDFEVERYKILGQPFCLQLWDTAGAERFKGVTTPYYRGANAVILTFDLSACEETLERTRDWLLEANDNCYSDFNIFLVGTKRDMVSDSDYIQYEKLAIDFAFELEAEYWCTSAKTGHNVVELFDRIAILAFESVIHRELEHKKESNTTTHQQVAEGSTLTRIKLSHESRSGRRKKMKGCGATGGCKR